MNTFNGISISEHRLIVDIVAYSLLLIIVLAIAAIIFYILIAAIKHKNKEILTLFSVLTVVIVASIIVLLSCGLIPAILDYSIKDYVVYNGDFDVHSYLRNSYTVIDDGTKLNGEAGCEDVDKHGTIVYAKRSLHILGADPTD